MGCSAMSRASSEQGAANMSSEQGAAYMSREQVRGRNVAALLVGSGCCVARPLQISRKST